MLNHVSRQMHSVGQACSFLRSSGQAVPSCSLPWLGVEAILEAIHEYVGIFEPRAAAHAPTYDYDRVVARAVERLRGLISF